MKSSIVFRVRPTRYAPARLQRHRYSILFLDLRRGRDKTRLSVIRVLVLCQSIKCKFRSMAHAGQTYHVTL